MEKLDGGTILYTNATVSALGEKWQGLMGMQLCILPRGNGKVSALKVLGSAMPC